MVFETSADSFRGVASCFCKGMALSTRGRAPTTVHKAKQWIMMLSLKAVP